MINNEVMMFSFAADEIVIVYTNHTNPTNQVTIPTEMNHFVFGLEACEYAIVALTTAPGETESNAWHVIIDQYEEGVHMSLIVNVDTGVSMTYPLSRFKP